MNKFITAVFFFAAAAAVFANGKSEPEAPAVRIQMVVPSGTPALAVAELIADNSDNADCEILDSPSLLSARIIGGEADAAVVPSNLAAVLAAKGVSIKAAAGLVWGTFYIVTREEVSSIEDLRGKELTVFGRGLTPDIVFRRLLSEAGIDPQSDVQLSYTGGVSEAAAAFIAGNADTVLIAEPAVTQVLSKVPEARIAVDLQQEWSSRTGGDSYPQAMLVLTGGKWDDQELRESFLRRVQEAAAVSAGQASQTASQLMPGFSAELLRSAYERCNIEYRSGSDFRSALTEYYTVLFEGDPKSIGGQMPGDDFWL